MRNLLGRLHARSLPELLRMADAWSIPAAGESKSDVVAALYRAMTDPRTMRDVWQEMPPDQQAILATLAGVADGERPPTLVELAASLGAEPEATRATATSLYRLGVLAREGDDDPLPVGEEPRLVLPREVALIVRRIQDEAAAGDLAASPLRVLMELMDDAELETASRVWGAPVLPGVASRQELSARLLRLVNDPRRLKNVTARRSRDAAAVWRVVHEAGAPVSLDDAMRASGLSSARGAAARQRAALAELEGALLVWHSYHRDGTRWLFIPREIRESGQGAPPTLPALQPASPAAVRWRPPEAFAWDLLTLLRLLSSPNAPAWTKAEPAPRWLRRVAAPLLWFGERGETPVGYFALLQALGLAEEVFLADESVQPARVVPGPQARAWRRLAFPEMTSRLRSRWLNLPAWVEGEAAGIVDVRGADWRGMRPRLLAALREAARETPAEWVSLESLVEWIVAAQPGLLGQSFRAATARAGGEIAGDVMSDEARAAALGDIVAFELTGPCAWFGLTAVAATAEGSLAVCVAPDLAPASSGTPPPPAPEQPAARTGEPTLDISESGEIAIVAPSPERVWALSAFAELVELGETSRYRLASNSVAGALSSGVRHDQIVEYLERASGRPLTDRVAASLAEWVQRLRIVRLEAATVLDLDDVSACALLARHLRRHGWAVTELTDRQLLVRPGTGERADVQALRQTLEQAGFSPRAAAEIAAGPPSAGPQPPGPA